MSSQTMEFAFGIAVCFTAVALGSAYLTASFIRESVPRKRINTKERNVKEEYENERIAVLREKIASLTHRLNPSDHSNNIANNQKLIASFQKELDEIYKAQEKRKAERGNIDPKTVCLVCQKSISSPSVVCSNCTATAVLDYYNRNRNYAADVYSSSQLYSSPQPQ